MMIRKQSIGERVFLVEFRTQYELAATFLRFQEFHESRRFRDRVFSLEEFMDWYAGKHGSFTYYEDWSGFNVPSQVLKPFRDGKFDPLLEKEKRFLDLFAKTRGDFYIIGVARSGEEQNSAVMSHELAHALFHTNQRYRTEVSATLRQYDTRRVKRILASLGYCDQVLVDEVHAYLL